MKWAENEVASLELSRKLKELGFPQNREGWYWVENKANKMARIEFWDDKFEHYLEENKEYINLYKAPTNSELGEWLPFYLPELGFLRIEKNEDGFHYYYDAIALKGCYFIEELEANARTKTLIWLKKNGCITFNQGDTNAQSR